MSRSFLPEPENFPVDSLAAKRPELRPLLQSLAQERNPELRAQALLNLGLRLEAQGDGEGAASLYRLVQGVQEKEAGERLLSLAGEGGFARHVERILPQVAKECEDPKTWALLIGTEAALGLGRWAGARYGRAIPSWLRRAAFPLREPVLRPALLGPEAEIAPLTMQMSAKGGGTGNSLRKLSSLIQAAKAGSRYEGLLPNGNFVVRALALHAIGFSALHVYMTIVEPESERDWRALRDEMRAEAEAALKGRKRDWTKPQFFIFSESLSDRTLSRSVVVERVRTWNEKSAGYRLRLNAMDDIQMKIRSMVASLYFDFFKHYAYRFPCFSDFLTAGKGNCVAQTKLILGLYEEAAIRLPENEGIAAQVFKNHLQPVRYKKNEAGEIIEVQSLVTGKILPYLVADIYDPDIFYVSFLKKHGWSSPKSFDELRIARAKDEHIQREPSGDSPWPVLDGEYPASESYYDGETPEDALIPPPDFGGVVREPTPAPVSPDAIPYKLFSESPKYSQDEWRPFVVDFDAFYFRTPEDRQQIQSLDPTQWTDFYASLYRVSIARFAASPTFRDIASAMKHPEENIPQLTPAQMEEYETFRKSLKNAEAFILSISDLAPEWNQLKYEDRMRKLSDGLPAWRTLRDDEEKWLLGIQERPADFILAFNQQSRGPENRMRQWLATQLSLNRGDSALETVEPIIRMLADPAQVQVEADPGRQTPFFPPPQELIWLDWEDADAAPLPPPEEPAPKEDPPPAALQISPRAMKQFLLLFGFEHKGMEKRWTDEVASDFAADSVDQDGAFSTHLKVWMQLEILREHPGATAETVERLHQETFRTSTPSRFLPAPLFASVQAVRKRSGDDFFAGSIFTPKSNPP